jgi:putative ATPase
VIVFARHSDESLAEIFKRALKNYDLQEKDLFQPDAKEYLFSMADGDARRFLNRLEEIIQYHQINSKIFPVDKEKVLEVLGTKNIYHDATGDMHYDTISAFIKSIRGSDPDAGLYYMARMLEGGEDPKFIARRLLILASEDVGNADPRALQIALAGFQAVELIGLPECAINLAQVVVYLACAPKSNSSYMGLKNAQAEVRRSGLLAIPKNIRNAPTKLMKQLGYSKGYQYSHEGETGWLAQQYLPDEIKNQKFYASKLIGYEKKMEEYQQWMKGIRKDTPKD